MLTQRHPKNILVTGGAGFIGSAFIRYTLQNIPDFQGQVINLDLLTYAGDLQNLSEVENNPRYFFRQGDINNQALVEHLCLEHQIDTIVHFAAESHVDRSIEHPSSFLETNVLGTQKLLEVVRNNPQIHFHHISTDEVFGCLGDTGSFNEDSPYNPNSPYSASKAASDHLVRAYGTTYNISYCISNCSNNYGPCQHPEKLIPLMLTNALKELPLPIYGEGKNVRDWLYVEDHVEAIWKILHFGVKGETYVVGGGAEWSNLQLVHYLLKELASIQNLPSSRLESLITFVKDRPGHDYRYAIDNSKIRNTLGWVPRHSFEEGLRKTILWYLARSTLTVPLKQQ